MIAGRPFCDRLPGRGGALASVLVLGLATLVAGCHRSVPPNVTPPGETAAFSEPSPAASATSQTETRK